MKILGISGKKGSGKTTLAKLLQQQVPGSVIINFADALKDEVSEACMCTHLFIEENKADFRTILQWWGTDFRRKFKGDDYWIKQWLLKVRELSDKVPLVICSDVRFPNEYNCIKSLESPIWRIERPSDILATDLHSSETSLDSFPFTVTIQNNSTLMSLEVMSHDLLKQIMK